MSRANRPIAWRVADAVADAIAAMDTTYDHPPTTLSDGTVMARVVEPPLLMYLDNMSPEVQAVYGVWKDTRTWEPESSIGSHTYLAVVTIQAFARYQPETESQYRVSSEAEKLRDELAADIEQLIDKEQFNQGGDMLGGLAERWTPRVVEPLFAGNFGTSGWAGVHYETDLWFHANLADPTAQGQV